MNRKLMKRTEVRVIWTREGPFQSKSLTMRQYLHCLSIYSQIVSHFNHKAIKMGINERVIN